MSRNECRQWNKQRYTPEMEIITRATPKQREFLVKHCGVSERTASETPTRVAMAIINQKIRDWKQ